MSKSVLPPRKSYLEVIKSSGLTEKVKKDVIEADELASKHLSSLAEKKAQVARAEAAREKLRKK